MSLENEFISTPPTYDDVVLFRKHQKKNLFLYNDISEGFQQKVPLFDRQYRDNGPVVYFSFVKPEMLKIIHPIPLTSANLCSWFGLPAFNEHCIRAWSDQNDAVLDFYIIDLEVTDKRHKFTKD